MEGSSKKKIRRRSFAKPKNNDEVRTRENVLNSTALNYDTLRIIFRYLNGNDLSTAAMVCRSWLEAANNEKRTRGPTCFLENYMLPDKLRDKESYNAIRNLKIRPSMGLFFTSRNSPYDYIESENDTEGCYCRFLPKNCRSVLLHTDGIIINETEMDEAYPDTACAFLPEIPNVKINTLRLSSWYSSSKKLKMINKIITSNADKPICLLIFCNQLARNCVKQIVTAVKNSNEKKIVSLWGGVVTDLHMCNKRKKRHCTDANYIGIVISGSIQTWSIVIDSKYDTEELVETKLKSLKDQVTLGKHSIGFMFACYARGEAMFDELGVESSIFKKLFPNVPLVGCSGDGEFGKNTVIMDADYKTNSKQTDSWYNELSTVFMILTYG